MSVHPAGDTAVDEGAKLVEVETGSYPLFGSTTTRRTRRRLETLTRPRDKGP